MQILQKMGYKTKTDHETERKVRADTKRLEEQRLAAVQETLETRIRVLQPYIAMYNSVSHGTYGVSVKDFNFACQKADAIENSAVIQGADAGYFKQLKINKW